MNKSIKTIGTIATIVIMSEEEAHRYLQKSSMDSGTNMVETAEMVLSIMAE